MKRCFTEKIYCVCQMPDDKTAMIKCDKCLKWFHMQCMGLDSRTDHHHMKWSCPGCLEVLSMMIMSSMLRLHYYNNTMTITL